MKEIGGYFEFELSNRTCRPIHEHAVALNSGRNALKYILLCRKPSKLHIPYYICSSVLDPIAELGIPYEYYSINRDFEPVMAAELGETEYLLYVNYFGLSDGQGRNVVSRYGNVIIDNTQAFFSKPYTGIDTFYSPRKFFGVADGGYAYTSSPETFDFDLERGQSFHRYEHLLKRIDLNAQEGYAQFAFNETVIGNEPMKRMSRLTEAILNQIDFHQAAQKRVDNFNFIHAQMKPINQLHLPPVGASIPMVYPLLVHDDELRSYLIRHKVYVATYWKELWETQSENTLEYELSKHLLPLPIDQRYGTADMEYLADLIKHYFI